MKKKIYLVQPSYRDRRGQLLKAGHNLFTHSLAIPALSAALPADWERDYCLEYFDPVDLDTDASVVAITCLGYDLFRGRELAEEFRKRGKLVLFGGYASELWKDEIRSVAHSVVCGNPGRVGLTEILADAVQGQVRPEYHCSTDLDYPFDYSVLARKGIASHITALPALASVGCSNQCEFCCTAARYRGRHYLRSLDAVMADLRALRRIRRHFVFVDSNFYLDRGHVLALTRRIVDERLGLWWCAEATVDVADDPEVLAALRRAGCRALLIGFETLSQRNLSHMQKPFVVARYREQIRRIQRAGIIVAGFFVFGFDQDDRSTADELSNFVRELDMALALFNFLCPVPGTRLHERMRSEGRLLVSGQESYLQQTVIYGAPTHRCLFQPKGMSPHEAELAFAELLERVTSWPSILRRCVPLGPILGPIALVMNLSARRTSRAVVSAVRA
jgi:radical SAM superfamily enzyme YgiQ (UPF0313 family)